MKLFYPFASGSLYTSSYAISASYAEQAEFIRYTLSSTSASIVNFPQSGSRGNSVCLLTQEQYLFLSASGEFEICDFDDEEDLSNLLV